MIHTRKKYIQSPQIFQSTSLGRGRRLIRHTAIERFWISIHVPRVEDDLKNTLCISFQCTFQSTSPVWRTTSLTKSGTCVRIISIHVPRVEDDWVIQTIYIIPRLFQSTSPVWRTTLRTARSTLGLPISIHVPRVEDDKERSIYIL